MSKFMSKMIGADTAIWPAAATSLSVTYTPGKVIGAGNVLIVDTLPAALVGARITSIQHKDSDLVSGIGSVPASVFAPGSFVNTARFGIIKPAEPVVVNFAVVTAPVANTDFPTMLGPLDAVRKVDLQERSAARKRIRATVKRKSAPVWKRALRGIWRRLPGVAGVGVADEDLEYALSGAFDEVAGSLDELIDAAVGAALDDEIAADSDDD